MITMHLIVDFDYDKERHAYQRNVLAQVTAGEIVAVRTLKHVILLFGSVVSPITNLPLLKLDPVQFVQASNVKENDLRLSTAEAAVQLGWHWFVRQN